ncbi:MAG: PAS domain-containing sensor histidine kinase [Candidatus Saccharimonadales bacterium]
MEKNNINTTPKSQVSTYYQYKFLSLFLGLSLGLVLLQGAAQYLNGNGLGMFFTSLSLLTLVLSWYILKKGEYQVASSLAILVVLSLLLYSILANGLGDSTIFWFFVFPVLAFYLKGKSGGTVWLLFLVLVVVSLFLASHIGAVETIQIEYDEVTFRQLIASLFLVSVFVYVYQDNVDAKENIIQQRENELADINKQLIDEVEEHKTTAENLAQTLKEIEKEKAKDEALLQSIGEGVLAIDKNGKVIAINSAARHMFGLHEADLSKKPWHNLFKLVDKDTREVKLEDRPLQKTLKSGQKVSSDEFFYVDSESNQVPVAVTSTPVILNKKVMGAVEVIRDISKEKAVERAKDEFVSLASHQLRTPLSAINWYSQSLLNRKADKTKTKKYLEAIKASSERMTDLVGDFLSVSRLELGTVKLRIEKVEAVDLLEQTLNDLTPTLKRKKIKLNKNVSNKKIQMLSDVHMLGLIFQNLLSNAVKYTLENGEVNVTLKAYTDEKDGTDHLLFSIEDTGIGIPKKEQGQVFSKLFRAENAETKDIEGTGLGLYLVKSSAKELGGRIWFESHEGKGSIFTVQLPIEVEGKSQINKTKKKGK